MESIQEPLWELPPPKPRVIDYEGVHDPVARVILDVPVYHLNQLFDYLIPPALADKAYVGMRVKVHLGRQQYEGWIVERANQSTYQGKLSTLDKVVGDIPVLTPTIYRLCQTIADECVAPISDVITHALPSRHATAEKAMLDNVVGVNTLRFDGYESSSLSGAIPITPQFNKHLDLELDAYDDYHAGRAFLENLRDGLSPRAVADVIPSVKTDHPGFVMAIHAIIATLVSGRKALFIVPTHDQATLFADMCKRLIPGEHVTVLTAQLPRDQRYRAFLEALLGQTRVVVGTLSAAYAPLGRLGFIGIWDEGDDRHRLRRSPYVHTRRILQVRAAQENTAYLSLSYTRTIDDQWLIYQNWAKDLMPIRERLRTHVPHVYVPDPQAMSAQPFSRIPPQAHKVISEALEEGPVIVLVPTRGYVPMVGCARCQEVARCPHCHGLIELLQGNRYRCRMCGNQRSNWECDNCHYHRLRAFRVGSERTGQEMARMFPQAPVIVSSGATMRIHSVGDKQRIVVATPTMAPRAENGYAAGVVLDAHVWLGRDTLDAQQNAMRAWQEVAALVRPEAPFYVAGWPGTVLAQSLIRWDSRYYATQALEERSELSFPPVYTVARLSGAKKDIEEIFANRLLDSRIEKLGPVPDEKNTWAGVLRIEARVGHKLTEALTQIVRERSVHRDPLVKVVMNPEDL